MFDKQVARTANHATLLGKGPTLCSSFYDSPALHKVRAFHVMVYCDGLPGGLLPGSNDLPTASAACVSLCQMTMIVDRDRSIIRLRQIETTTN